MLLVGGAVADVFTHFSGAIFSVVGRCSVVRESFPGPMDRTVFVRGAA